ncbi:hypothetical protein N7507_005617 [Penicillium longicatenatum]|nr:hypothetical protein N7507_005617 [Penicillium longicatenatum]
MEQPEQPASPGVASASLGLDLDIVPTFQARGLSSIFDASLFEPFFDLEPWSPQLPSELVMQSQPSMEGRELLPFKDSISCVLAQAESIHQSESTSERTCVALANHSMELIFRVFRTWPQMLAEGFQLPPIFHSTHFASPAKLPKPLATCITLVKMWNGQCAGAEGIVRATIRQQLDQVVDVVSYTIVSHAFMRPD